MDKKDRLEHIRWLTKDQRVGKAMLRAAVVYAYRGGALQREIAEVAGVSRQAISRWIQKEQEKTE